jgi:hypothetical protein
MPSFGLVTLSGAVVRPLIVAIAHIPVLVIACSATLVWITAVVRPTTHGDLGLKLVRELRTWSCDVIGATAGMRQQ